MLSELLTKVSEIHQLELSQKEEAQKRGDNFNPFVVCKVKADEMRHSGIIACLLDPRESHGQKDNFLKLFLDKIKGDDHFYDDFNTKSTKVFTEYSVGEMGRIDILLKSGRKSIVIENKLYAQDQYEQLIRYDSFLSKSASEHRILYLTLDGKDAEKYSAGDIKYTSISYRDDIINWLESCADACSDTPNINVFIKQYIFHLKTILNLPIMTDDTKQKYLDLLTSEENLEEISVIYSLKDDVYKHLLHKLVDKLQREIKGYEIEVPDNFYEPKQYVGLLFKFNTEVGDFSIELQAEHEYWSDFIIGYPNNYIKASKPIDMSKLDCLRYYNPGDWKLGFEELDGEYHNWGIKELRDMIYKDDFVKYLQAKLDILRDSLLIRVSGNQI